MLGFLFWPHTVLSELILCIASYRHASAPRNAVNRVQSCASDWPARLPVGASAWCISRPASRIGFSCAVVLHYNYTFYWLFAISCNLPVSLLVLCSSSALYAALYGVCFTLVATTRNTATGRIMIASMCISLLSINIIVYIL